MAQNRLSLSQEFQRRVIEESEETIRRSRELLADTAHLVTRQPPEETPEQVRAALRGIWPETPPSR